MTETITSRKAVLEQQSMLTLRFSSISSSITVYFFFLGFLKCFDFDLTYFVFHRNDENFVQFLTWVFILLLFLQAITFCPNIPVYYTNRALCHLKRKYVFYSSFGCILCLGFLILVCDWDCVFL